MNKYANIPVIPLRGLTVLPKTTVHFDISRSGSIKAAKTAMESNGYLCVITQKDPEKENPGIEDLYNVGTLVKVVQLNKLNNGIIRVLAEGLAPVSIDDFSRNENMYIADLELVDLNKVPLDKDAQEAYVRELKKALETFFDLNEDISQNTIKSIMQLDDLEEINLQIMMRLKTGYIVKQCYLEQTGLEGRVNVVFDFLTKESNIENIRRDIVRKVKERLDKGQREHILREQMEVIRGELGEDANSEIAEFEEKIEALDAADEVKEKLKKELSRLKEYGGNNPDSNLLHTYIETMLEMPWNKKTEESKDIAKAREILDRDHYGLKKVKERVLEFLAVRALKDSNVGGPIICLVGPPGTGKTSIAKSVAEALNKKYVRISLGGVDDESEIRGHRKTYVGAMPGRIAKALSFAGSSNPLILFDEIDKLGYGIHGDPASALLEVMDSEQNSKFRDNYLEVPVDLSEVLFIATANNLDTIPEPLLDRMELIEVEGYTENEKFHIAKEHLVKKELEKNGLKKSQLNITDAGIKDIITKYTREAGVRQLDREIGRVCRKAAIKIVEENKAKVNFTSKNITEFLGKEKFRDDDVNKKDDVGIVTGLAWTAVGGVTLQIEVNTMPGKGNLKLTGQLGDVMKESAQIAISYVRSIMRKYKVDDEFFNENDIHIHIPEGAVPKDGPSAGITMATAILSAITNIKVRHLVAMTGEITLRGKVMPIGGLKEKILAAKLAGMKKVLVPFSNEADVAELSEEITSGLEIVYVKTMDEVIKNALVGQEK